ncbi:MAG: hypothetical protein ACI9N1_002732, partial [Flavobacteriales bacterium]
PVRMLSATDYYVGSICYHSRIQTAQSVKHRYEKAYNLYFSHKK